MAYRDENGKITIDDVAAGEDIRKIERAQAILQNALQSLRAAQTEGANSKGQTAQAIYDKSQEISKRLGLKLVEHLHAQLSCTYQQPIVLGM